MRRIHPLLLPMASALWLVRPGIAEPATPTPPPVPEPGRYQFLSPLPGSRLVSPRNNIVVRQGGLIDAGTIDPRLIAVTGTSSGSHAGALVLSDDRRTLVYTPTVPFSAGETVQVHLDPGVKTLEGRSLPALDFDFSVSLTDPRNQPIPPLDEFAPGAGAAAPPAAGVGHAPSAAPPALPCDILPADYPATLLLASSDPDSGVVFAAPFRNDDNDGHLLILDDAGMPLFYRTLRDHGAAQDFKRQPNGLLTYYLSSDAKFYALDSAYAVVDSFEAGNGYRTDVHELKLLPDGHALLMSYDGQIVDMSAVVPGGNPNALVIGLIIQELDAARNVVFQWRSWDHFAITDDASPAVPLTGAVIDYVHGNALERDDDGNILLSSRHMNEITKIDRQTGDIIWRLGLHAVNNQFTFVNDARGFSHQHDIRRLANGHITLFDNGNFLLPTYSRAVEYALDEVNHVATEVWEYRNTPDSYGGAMGDAQRHTSGGTLVGWGATLTNPKLTDVHADGSKAFEVGFLDSTHVFSYRSFRFPWRANRFATDVDSLAFGSLLLGDSAALSVTVRNTSASEVTIGCVAVTDPAYSVPGWAPLALAPGDSASLAVVFAPGVVGEHAAHLYLRQVADTELVAQGVALRGLGTTPLAAPGARVPRFALEARGPNPFGVATTLGFSLPRAARVRLEIMDLQGRKLETLVDGDRPAGDYEVRWKAGNRPDGVYFCRLQAGTLVATRKLLVMR